MRQRAGHAWRAVLASAAELWNVATALWLSPFCFAPGALAEALPEDAGAAGLGPSGALPSEPWDLMAHWYPAAPQKTHTPTPWRSCCLAVLALASPAPPPPSSVGKLP